MSNISQYIPLTSPAILYWDENSQISEDFALLKRRHVVTIAAAGLLLISAWAKALPLALSIPLILGAALVVIYLDRKRATEGADRATALHCFDRRTDPGTLRILIPRIHKRIEAARLFVEKIPFNLATVPPYGSEADTSEVV
ncbi:MAG TPA: hypothetical protein VGM34_00505, partial [Chlamydiales bacterium]